MKSQKHFDPRGSEASICYYMSSESRAIMPESPLYYTITNQLQVLIPSVRLPHRDLNPFHFQHRKVTLQQPGLGPLCSL